MSAALDKTRQKRPRVIRIPDIDWVEIPAGEFIYGEGESKQTLYLDSFHIARYPITNSQYQTFIDAGGYVDERWWEGLKKPEPESPTWKQSNRPRTEVDWYEAVAFARWLTVALGYEVRLPTEQEWEQAARGTGGRIYPWGDKYRSGYANVDEKEREDGPWYLEQTTAVGMYPHGRSPLGVADMAGTVWEWCLNKYDQPDMTTPDASGDRRVLRGGSWLFSAGRARADYRHWYYPDSRYHFGGFRLLSSVPIADR
jgi:formylglycine-generating enzyme required for sulfatase activity